MRCKASAPTEREVTGSFVLKCGHVQVMFKYCYFMKKLPTSRDNGRMYRRVRNGFYNMPTLLVETM